MNYWESSDIVIYIVFVSIFSVISFIIWLIYLFRFNPFKRFADDATVRKPGSALLEFGSYWLAISVFVIWPFIPPAIESYRTYRQISANEVAQDVNELNFKIAAIEFDKSIMEFTADTVVFYMDEKTTPTYRQTEYTASYYHFDKLEEVLSAKDSSTKLNDTSYVRYDAPRLNFVDVSELDKVAKTKQYTAFELWNQAKEAQSVGLDRMQYYADIVRICKKYNKDWVEVDYQGIPRKQLKVTSFQEIDSKYDVYQIASVIQGVSSRMTRWLPDMLFLYGHVLFYIASALSMAIFAFRHFTTKPYFLTYLVGFLIVVFTSLFVAISNVGSSISVLLIVLCYFLAFAVIATTVFVSKRRRIIQGIAINLAFYMLPFIPYLLTILYLETKRLGTTGEEYDIISSLMTSCIPVCELIGFGFLLIVIEFGFKKLYTHWYALSEEYI